MVRYFSIAASKLLTNMPIRIIVGVKYCFRYNQRNRARLAGEDPDAVDLTAMPRQRRRREKKLMTMDEVNEKFPLAKYKTWRSTRAQEGLPTAGGINTASSRPASVKNMPRASEDKDRDKAQPNTTDPMGEKLSPSEPSSPVAARHDKPAEQSDDRPKTAISETITVQKTTTHDDDDEDGDQIQTAIPAEQLPDPGDTCAICIDALEDDDDIRGLTCGHAFHASCVDPWLTSRRACCPLCKADYYVPKPRPEGEAEELQRRRTREEQPPATFIMGRGARVPAFTMFRRRFLGVQGQQQNQQQNTSQPQNTRRTRQQRPAPGDNVASPSDQTAQQQSWRTRLNLPRRPPLSRIRNGSSNDQGQQPAPTPAQLEAGQNR